MLKIPQYKIQIFANPQLSLIVTFYPIMQFPNVFDLEYTNGWAS